MTALRSRASRVWVNGDCALSVRVLDQVRSFGRTGTRSLKRQVNSNSGLSYRGSLCSSGPTQICGTVSDGRAIRNPLTAELPGKTPASTNTPGRTLTPAGGTVHGPPLTER